MDDRSLEILTDVTAQLAMAASALRRLAQKSDIDKAAAIIVLEQAERVGSQIAEINRATGWNGRDFKGDGSVITASYNASELHRVAAAVLDAVGSRPTADIAHVMPVILETFFPQLKSDREE